MTEATISPITLEYPLRRSKFGDWRVLLDRFALLTEADA
jgi:hypothetical protein